MPATTDIHTKEMHKEHVCENGEESKNMTASNNCGFFCEERGYLDQIQYILQHGRRKGDRTGTGVVSVFGSQARYSLRGSVALSNYIESIYFARTHPNAHYVSVFHNTCAVMSLN